jgi:hypothetical protein
MIAMRLTWKDGAATVVTAAVVGLYVAFLAGADLPLVSGPRALGTVVLALGMVGCALGSPDTSVAKGRSFTAWTATLSGIGVVALVAALFVLITGSEAVLAVLVGSVVALWLLATVRHIVGGLDRGRVTDRDLRRLIEVDRERHRERHRI